MVGLRVRLGYAQVVTKSMTKKKSFTYLPIGSSFQCICRSSVRVALIGFA